MKCDVSIIYVYYNTPKEILDSVQSVRSGAGRLTYEIIVIDNSSPKPLPKELKNEKIIKIKNKRNVGYGAGLNLGESYAKGKYLLCINPDTLFAPRSIEKMIQRMEKEKNIGVLGPQVIAPNNTIAQSFGGLPLLPGALFIFSFLNKLFPTNRFSQKYWLHNLDRNIEHFVDHVSGVCMLIRKNIFDKVNGFDSRFFMYFEEADFCLRVKNLGYKILYYPDAKIMHFEGRSLQNKDKIEKIFEKSRFRFFKKYHGFLQAFLAEFFLRFTKKENLTLFSILLFSSFLNLYRINTIMMFIGDMGRDYLAARDMILQGRIPFVGIQSSVVWLHQGPLSIYLIGLAFLLSKFNPAAPAIFYGIIGVFSTYLVYVLGKKLFNKTVGLLACLFYATSPLSVINARMPYHTSSIPFFALLFFLLLYKAIRGNRALLPWLSFVLGILLEVELSNAVLIFLILCVWFLYKPKLIRTDYLKACLGFLLGILPFILYDLTHRFVQTIGFPIWIVNRARLFFGLTSSGASTTIHAPEALYRIYQQITGIIFPQSIIVVGILVLLSFFIFFKNKKGVGLWLVVIWIFIPLVGFIIHTGPGTAYFPLIFPAIALMLGYLWYVISKNIRFTLFIFMALCLYNAWLTLQNEYFLNTKKAVHSLPPESYVFGVSIDIIQDVTRFIVQDANGRQFWVVGGGYIKKISTGVDNYKFLAWYYGGSIKEDSHLIYTIFEDKNAIPRNKPVLYHNKYILVTKNEE